MPLILGTNSIKETGFDVANSVRYNDGDSPKMVKSSTAGNRTNWTFSAWFKRSGLGASQDIMASSDGSNNYCYLQINSDDKMRFLDYSSGNNCNKITNRLFRDTSAWMNVVLAVDTTDGTAEDRFKLYINGVRETSFATSANFSSSFATNMNVSGHSNAIGTNQTFNGQYFDGYLAEIVLVDSTTLAPTDNIGEFDSDSGIWKPIDVSGLTFGNNGFYLDFEDSSNLGNDANGGTDFTETNLAAIDQSTDTCTNNFATLNPLDNYYPASTFSEGNLKIVTSSNETYNTSTIGVSSGKWYFEVEWDATSSGTSVVGIVDSPSSATSASLHKQSKGWGYRDGGDVKNNDSAVSGSWSSYTTGDIIGIALDLDNNRLFFSKNGSFQNSGDPTSSTGAITITAPSSLTTGNYFFAIGDYNSGTTTLLSNFGGTQSFTVSSGNTDGNGYGNFEYAVPSGYYSLNTKNLAEYG